MNAPVSFYQFTPEASATFAELDEVRLVSAARTKYGQPLSVGSEGTVLAVWSDGSAYVVEFDEGLATIKAEDLTSAA